MALEKSPSQPEAPSLSRRDFLVLGIAGAISGGIYSVASYLGSVERKAELERKAEKGSEPDSLRVSDLKNMFNRLMKIDTALRRGDTMDKEVLERELADINAHVMPYRQRNAPALTMQEGRYLGQIIREQQKIEWLMERK